VYSNINGFVTGIFGGFLLGVRSVTGLAFYDWETLELVRRIEIQPRHVFWSESGELVCLATEESYFILKYDSSVVSRAHETKEGFTEDGVEDAFTVSLLLLDGTEPRSG
jgi:coatomer subunit beta'